MGIAVICGLVGIGVPHPQNRFGIISNILAVIGMSLAIHVTCYTLCGPDNRGVEFLLTAMAGFGGAPLFSKLRDAILAVNIRKIAGRYIDDER